MSSPPDTFFHWLSNWQQWAFADWLLGVGILFTMIGMVTGADQDAYSETRRIRPGVSRTTYHKAYKADRSEKKMGWWILAVGVAIWLLGAYLKGFFQTGFFQSFLR